MKKFFYLIPLLYIGLTGCDNELDINSAWVETPVVYGFLDAYRDTQQIRIEKTYQNSVNLTTMEGAKLTDSIYFDTLVVRTVCSDGSVDTFQRVQLPKPAGTFGNDVHYVYQKAGFKPGTAGITKKYRLEIYNPKSGKSYLSPQISLLDSARFGTSGNYAGLTPPGVSGDMGTIGYNMAVGANASIYDLFIRFNYIEHYTDGSSATKFLDYVMQKNWKVSFVNSKYSPVIPGQTYYDYLRTNIKTSANVTSRDFVSIESYASGGSADLAYVTDLSQPSTTIVPKSTQYTNITGALGIFSSISIHKIQVRVTKPTQLADFVKLLPQFN